VPTDAIQGKYSSRQLYTHTRLRKTRKTTILAISVESKSNAFDPFAVIGIYNPPNTSTFNTGGRHWSNDIIATVTQCWTRLRNRYQRVLLVGDFNMRLGNTNGRFTDDALAADTAPHRAANRTEVFSRLLQTLHAAPVHGRTQSCPGVSTSASNMQLGKKAELTTSLSTEITQVKCYRWHHPRGTS
jgi:exonuclease III